MQLPPASQRHRPRVTATAPASTRPALGGWLIALAAGMVILPVRIAVSLIEDIAPAFTTEVWTALTTPGSPAYHPLNAPILLFELIGNAVLLMWSAVAVAAFFLKHRLFPHVTAGFLLASLLFYVADYFAAERLATAQGLQPAGPIWDLAGAGILCAILIPYLFHSQRVKKTFRA